MARVGRLQSVIVDCPDAKSLAEFYRDLLGWKIDYAGYEEGDGFASMTDGGPIKLCVQEVANYQRPQWPDQSQPQQFHLDVEVDDLEAAEQAATALGAARAEVQPGKGYRVYLDPAGHPFCLQPKRPTG